MIRSDFSELVQYLSDFPPDNDAFIYRDPFRQQQIYDAIVAATGDAALALGWDTWLGTLEKDKFDFQRSLKQRRGL